MNPTSAGVPLMIFQSKIEKNSMIDIGLVRLFPQEWSKVDRSTVKLLAKNGALSN